MRKRYRWGKRARELIGDFEVQLIPTPIRNTDPIIIFPDEFLAWKLSDFENKTQEEICLILRCSRPTISKLINSARRKVLQGILEGRPILIKS